MKKPPEVRTALSLKKEYETLLKQSAACPLDTEKQYYYDMAQRTNSRIRWDLLENKQKYNEEEKEYYYEG